jgi:hypothetical protein
VTDKNKKIVFDSQDRDQVIKQIITLDDDNLHAKTHLGTKVERTVNTDGTRKYTYWSERDQDRGYTYYSDHQYPIVNINDSDRLALLTVPSWGVVFPPFPSARLSAVARQAGYEVDVYDVNIEAYHYMKDKIDINLWESNNYYMWEYSYFKEIVKPLLSPLLDTYVDIIINSGATIAGFTIYNTSIFPVYYMIEQLKLKKPTITIVIGGPEATSTTLERTITEGLEGDISLIDYVVIGEGEQELISIFKEYRTILPDVPRPIFKGNTKSRLSLDELPLPDYSDFDLNLYEAPDGLSLETSRGCVAKCTFCSETHFWKYRWRDNKRVIDEMKHLKETYGVRRFWIIDSLVNGNFKQFKELVEMFVEEKLDIQWNSYARCDGRMDADLFKTIVDSGCTALSFGVESGSNKVLKDMKKNVEVWEIENNLRDAQNANLRTHVNWVTGFPTEDTNHFVHSLQMLFNCRNWIFAISPGYGCGIAPASDIDVNWKNYDIQWINEPWDNMFLGHWWTKDYKNTMVHRALRVMFTQIWLNMLDSEANATMINAQVRDLTNFYDIEFLDKDFVIADNTVQLLQNFNVFTGDTTLEKFSGSLANEHVAFAWAIYNAFGPYKMSIKSTPDMYKEEFGALFDVLYTTKVDIEIDSNKNMKFNMVQSFDHVVNADPNPAATTRERDREDMSFSNVVHVLRCDADTFTL